MPPSGHGFHAQGLFVGKGASAIEVVVASATDAPGRAALLDAWRTRRASRAAPVLLVVLYPNGTALCGASGDTPPIHRGVDRAQAERLCRELLDQPDRHAALRFLNQALPSLETLLPGVNNEGLVALHELQHGARSRGDISPVSYALAKADDENLDWVLVVQGNRLRLYSTTLDAGVGRRGRTETFVECQPTLLADRDIAYLWLLFSADALAPGGSLAQILEDSHRFAGDLAAELRERIYQEVVPTLAHGVANQRGLSAASPRDEVDRAYAMALTILFRQLFIAYAEDRDLLPYRHNDAYRRRSLKQKAQELAAAVHKGAPIAGGDSHWSEVRGLWKAVSDGNSEWGVPAYDGGLFSADAEVSAPGAGLAALSLSNDVFEKALRALPECPCRRPRRQHRLHAGTLGGRRRGVRGCAFTHVPSGGCGPLRHGPAAHRRGRGVFFCAAVGERTCLRFVPADGAWNVAGEPVRETGTCLRLIECEPETPVWFPEFLADRVYDFWDAVRQDIRDDWMLQTDPVNLQPRVRPLNLRSRSSSAATRRPSCRRSGSTGHSTCSNRHGHGARRSCCAAGSTRWTPTPRPCVL